MILTNVVIANAATASGGVDIQGYRIVGIIAPAMTGTTLAIECAQGNVNAPPAGAAYVPVFVSGSAFTVAIGTARHIALDESVLAGVGRFVRLVSNAAEGGARTLTILLRRDDDSY